jgi:hypothetical protein
MVWRWAKYTNMVKRPLFNHAIHAKMEKEKYAMDCEGVVVGYKLGRKGNDNRN